jgi:hypothetical protein
LTLPSEAPPGGRTYSSGFRRVLSLGALVTAILPAPVLFFQLLPAYGVQAKFLLFYGPLVCLLTLAYLFYIRDALARAMFADLLDPAPEPDPYYGERSGASARRFFRRVRSTVLALLPVALLLGSSYSALEYLHLVNRSVAETVAQKLREPVESAAAVSGEPRHETSGGTTKTRTRRGPKGPAAQVETTPPPPRPDTVRQYILRTTKVDDIPSFARLSVLYIGIFLCAEVAFILMALKEYAKEAMGLSERDLMMGPQAVAPP